MRPVRNCRPWLGRIVELAEKHAKRTGNAPATELAEMSRVSFHVHMYETARSFAMRSLEKSVGTMHRDYIRCKGRD